MMVFVTFNTALTGSVAAHARTSKPTTQQLQKEILQWDAIIRILIRRVENLERQVGTGDLV
jgi:hypothetical protein